MLSDEEKEAIEWLKRLVKINKRDNLDNTFAEILLNLIEKQSKEIEELKEKNEYLLNWVSKKYIRKDKIKAKIEEIDEEIKVKREIAKNLTDRVSGRLLTDNIVELEKVKRVVQSILEEEE